ncbi:MAG: hypothetical protein KAR06_11940, partial [Deltaproteobacteria bacterium]|nr:hypothetical protein [Deltaproteobacteria bacterium]
MIDYQLEEYKEACTQCRNHDNLLRSSTTVVTGIQTAIFVAFMHYVVSDKANGELPLFFLLYLGFITSVVLIFVILRLKYR